MKWFKHISDSLEDPFISDLISTFGPDGYLAFFGILEIMAREFDANNPGNLEVSINFLRRRIRLSKKKTLRILDFFREKNRMHSTFKNVDGIEKVFISCPKFEELCDQHTQKVLRNQEYKYNNGSESWEKIKKSIRKRDNFICRICGKTTEENKRSF